MKNFVLDDSRTGNVEQMVRLVAEGAAAIAGVDGTHRPWGDGAG